MSDPHGVTPEQMRERANTMDDIDCAGTTRTMLHQGAAALERWEKLKRYLRRTGMVTISMVEAEMARLEREP